jgi:hypothetical protein
MHQEPWEKCAQVAERVPHPTCVGRLHEYYLKSIHEYGILQQSMDKKQKEKRYYR